MQTLEGQELGGVKLIRKIGEGGMGEVYLGEQIGVGNRLVAVKIVRPGDGSLPANASADIERRFKREAAILGKFDHPNILPIYDSGVQDGYLYIVMPYAQEGSLSDTMRGRFGRKLDLPIDLANAVDINSQVASALQYTHEHDVVHRDVKPGNVLIHIEPDGSWRMLLADYGVARGQDSTTQRTMVSGTFAYMAPEQFSGEFSPASDQYALAVMTYQLLAGRTPFEGDMGTLTRAHLYEQPPSLRAYNPSVPEGVELVIARALAKKPQQRYPSVALFADALRAVASGVAYKDSPGAADAPTPTLEPPGAPAEASPDWQARTQTQTTPPTSRPNSSAIRLIAVILAAILLLVVLIGGNSILTNQRRQQDAAATQTASAAGTTSAQSNGTTVAQAAQTAAAATATAAFTIPTATATSSLATDQNAPPPTPPGVGSLVFSDPSPTCDQPAGPAWAIDDSTTTACPAGGGVAITAKSTSALACIEQRNPSVKDGYTSVLAGQQSGDVALAFRLGAGTSSGTTLQVIGYYFKVSPATRAYVLYKIEASGAATALSTGSLPATLAPHFALSALYRGSSITLYINGVQLASPITDTTFSSGWMGACATGSTTFRDAQTYNA